MSNYAELGAVRTWYDERGKGKPLLLLHPGMVDARAFAPNIDAVAARLHVFTPGRRGHGRTPDVEGPITYALMAQDTIAFIEGAVGGLSPDGPEHFPIVAAKMARMHAEDCRGPRHLPPCPALVHDDAERRLLERRLAELGTASGRARQ